MAQVFIYLRHGAYNSDAPNRDIEPLEPLGKRQAERAGEAIRAWLEARGRQIDRVVRTGKRRTEQTAEIAIGDLAPPTSEWVEQGGSKGLPKFFEKIDAWRADLSDDAVLLFSGHQGNYSQLCRWCGHGVVGDDIDHGSVLILEHTDDGWMWRHSFTPSEQRRP